MFSSKLDLSDKTFLQNYDISFDYEDYLSEVLRQWSKAFMRFVKDTNLHRQTARRTDIQTNMVIPIYIKLVCGGIIKCVSIKAVP